MSNREEQAVASTSGRKLRVLALHSWRTSATIFQQQMARAKLDVQLGDLLDITYIDAPHAASGPIPDDVAPYFQGPYREWVTAEQTERGVEFDLDKVSASHAFIVKALRTLGPFDGLMGFSQGAVLSAAIVAMQLAGRGPKDIPPLRFCILFAGMKSRYPGHTAVMADPVNLPSLHIWGEKDFLKKHCEELAYTFLDPVVLLHKRGHVIPPLAGTQLVVARSFLQHFMQPGSKL